MEENYMVRKVNSNKTQILHRIRLRKWEPNTVLQAIRPRGTYESGISYEARAVSSATTANTANFILWEGNVGVPLK